MDVASQRCYANSVHKNKSYNRKNICACTYIYTYIHDANKTRVSHFNNLHRI